MVPESVPANRPVYPWTPALGGRYEVWYGKVGGFHPEHAAALWFRITLEDVGEGVPRGTCWGSWFEEGIPEPVHLTSQGRVPTLEGSSPGYEVAVSPEQAFGYDADAGTFFCRGHVGDEATGMSWDLRWPPQTSVFRYLSWEWLRRLVSPSGACTPSGNARMSGEVSITLAGETRRFETDGAKGQQGHIWGTRKAHAWAWCHGNDWVDAETGEPVDASFEAIRMRRSPTAPALTAMHVHLDGRDHYFNSPLDLIAHRPFLIGPGRVGNSGSLEGGELFLEHHGELPVKAHFSLPPDQVALVEYADTDGSVLSNRNATLANAELTVGGRKLRSRLGATLEIVERP